MRLAALALLTGCVVPYVPETSWHPDVALGCLDAGARATRRPEATGPIVVLYLGNRCEHRVLVDLGAARVVAGNDAGETATASAYDPDREIGPRTIGARVSGEEWIEYRTASPLPIDWLDVDLGGIAPDAGRTEHWVRVRISP